MMITEIPFTALDGAPSAYTVYEFEGKPEAPVVLILPAMGADASYYKPFAKKLVPEGFHVITADWRGKGLSGLRASRDVDFGYREIWHYDFPALFESIRAHFPANPILVYGHSLGGQLSSLYLAAHPEQNVQGLILHMACHCYHRNWKAENLKLRAVFFFFPRIARAYGYFPGQKLGFAGREARTFMRDWGHSGLRGKYHAKGLVTDYDSLGEGLQIPILAFSLEDDWLAPRKGLEHLCSLFPNAPVVHYHVGEDGHGDRPLSHFNWVYQPDFFVGKLKEWLPIEVSAGLTPPPEASHKERPPIRPLLFQQS